MNLKSLSKEVVFGVVFGASLVGLGTSVGIGARAAELAARSKMVQFETRGNSFAATAYVSKDKFSAEGLKTQLEAQIQLAQSELRELGIEPDATFDRATLAKVIDEIIKSSAPYLQGELNRTEIRVPHVELTKDYGGVLGAARPALIKIPYTLPLEALVKTVPHELGHAQASLVFRGKLGNETYVQTLTLEVLANQALDGNLLARYAFLRLFAYGLDLEHKKEASEKLSDIKRKYYREPVTIILAALNGQIGEYKGIALDGAVRLIREMTAPARVQPYKSSGWTAGLVDMVTLHDR